MLLWFLKELFLKLGSAVLAVDNGRGRFVYHMVDKLLTFSYIDLLLPEHLDAVDKFLLI